MGWESHPALRGYGGCSACSAPLYHKRRATQKATNEAAFGLRLCAAIELRNRSVDLNGSDKQLVLWRKPQQALPVVSLKKEFGDFFDNPDLNKFTPGQDFFFVILTALGWLLGLIVLAAVATITHGP
jgi:hypothetical protein